LEQKCFGKSYRAAKPAPKRAGLDFATEAGLEHGGYVPKGRKAVDRIGIETTHGNAFFLEILASKAAMNDFSDSTFTLQNQVNSTHP
jgi:hypothetical protein